MGQGRIEGAAHAESGLEQSGLVDALRGACGAPCALRYEPARAQAAAAREQARARGATLEAAIAQAALAAAHGALDDLDAARRHRSGAAALLARVPGAAAEQRAEALLWLAVVDWSGLGDVRSARDRLARAAVIQDAAPPDLAVSALALRTLASTTAGDLPSAGETARAALATARAAGDPRLVALALMADAWQLTMRGETAAALAAGDELLALPGLGDHERAVLAASAAGHALIDAGDAGRSLALLASATTPARLDDLHPRTRVQLLELRARAAIALEDVAEARLRLEALQAVPYARTPLGAAKTGCAAALLALLEDNPLHAEALATAAAEAARTAPSRLLEVRTTLIAGRAQAALGAPEIAADRFAEAEQAARAAGAMTLAREAAQRRHALTGAPADGRTAAEYGLTERQLEIARLVASGRTNREVAAALGISDHTVNTHLRVVFRRFGVSKRRALAAALEAQGGASAE